MCGIGGFFRFEGGEAIHPNRVTTLLTALANRGAHATGLAILNGKSVSVLKGPEIAWEFVGTKEYADFLKDQLTPETDAVLLHTRQATIGSPNNNKNNHPMFDGAAAAVHNGTISNADHLFSNMKLKRVAETDSDIIRAIVDEEGITEDAFTKLNQMRGGCASAIVHPDFPGRLMLLRSGSPMVIAYHDQAKQLIWASTKDHIHSMMRIGVMKKGLLFYKPKSQDMYFHTVGNDTGFIFEQGKGMVLKREFSTAWSNYTTPTYRVHESFEEAQKRFRNKKRIGKLKAKALLTSKEPDRYICRNNACNAVIIVPIGLSAVPLNKLWCPTCDTTLGE